MIYILPCSGRGRSWEGHPPPPSFLDQTWVWRAKQNFLGDWPLPFFRVYFTCSQHIQSSKGWLHVTILYKSMVPFDNIDSLILTLKGLQ